MVFIRKLLLELGPFLLGKGQYRDGDVCSNIYNHLINQLNKLD